MAAATLRPFEQRWTWHDIAGGPAGLGHGGCRHPLERRVWHGLRGTHEERLLRRSVRDALTEGVAAAVPEEVRSDVADALRKRFEH